MFLKLALVSAVIYVAIALVIEVAVMILARARGGSGFYTSPLGWFILFGAFWLVSFFAAWRLIISKLTH